MPQECSNGRFDSIRSNWQLEHSKERGLLADADTLASNQQIDSDLPGLSPILFQGSSEDPARVEDISAAKQSSSFEVNKQSFRTFCSTTKTTDEFDSVIGNGDAAVSGTGVAGIGVYCWK